MPLAEGDRLLLSKAGNTANPTTRRQAVAIVLAQSGEYQQEALNLLSEGFLQATTPSFHYIPRGSTMASHTDFEFAYQKLALYTNNFQDVSEESLVRVLTDHPYALAPLRMILGLTPNEFSWAMRAVSGTIRTSGNTLKNLERGVKPARSTASRAEMIRVIARAALAIMNRSILQIPRTARRFFHSKLEKRDTKEGWRSVASSAGGVPYSALLYQRYVGGVWRQVQDAYSEVKGDKLLEQPIEDLLINNGISYYRTGRGAAGAAETEKQYGLSPGPDFLVPRDPPLVTIEAKVAEDGGTARDKASRIKNAAGVARARGLLPCAVIDGKGWSERPSAVGEVVLATDGRTYSLTTLYHLLDLPEVAAASR